MFGFRFLKTQPTQYVMHYRNGRPRREGAGLAFWYFAPRLRLSWVPTASVSMSRRDAIAPPSLTSARARQGKQMSTGGSRVGARPAEMEGVAQAGLVLRAAGLRDAGDRRGEGETAAEDAGPGPVLAKDRIEAGKGGAGEKGGFRFGFRDKFYARPSRERRWRGSRKALDFRGMGGGEPAAAYSMAARLAIFFAMKRRARLSLFMSDKFALSDIAHL